MRVKLGRTMSYWSGYKIFTCQLAISLQSTKFVQMKLLQKKGYGLDIPKNV